MSGRATFAASMALAGGVAAGVGSFLPWVEFSAGPISEQATGISGWEGKATLIASVVVIVAATRVFMGGADASSRLRGSSSVGGLVAVGVGLYTAITAREQLLDAAEADLSRVVVQDALDSGLLELSLAIGLFVVIAGGALSVLAAVVPAGPSEIVRSPSGRGLTGWSTVPPEPAASRGDPPAASPHVSGGPWATPPRPDVEPNPPS